MAKIWYWQPEIKLVLPTTILTIILFPTKMVEDKISLMEANADLSIESNLVLLPEGNRWILIQIFPLGDSNMPTSMKGSTGGTPLPYFLPQDLTTQWPVTLLVDPSSNWEKISLVH